MTTEVTNPYWDEVAHLVAPERWGQGLPVVEQFCLDRHVLNVDRNDICGRYAWTITDPAAVAFVAEHARGKVVDPLAGSGYWLWLLAQLGVDGIGYDRNPPTGGGNNWHKAGIEHVEIRPVANGADASATHPDRTLLLAWPPYDDTTGETILRRYRGGRVIYVGEGEGGCCGDDAMFERLAKEWTEVALHRPVQFWGIHDYVTVYDRKDGS
jgi:hypothetical protein